MISDAAIGVLCFNVTRAVGHIAVLPAGAGVGGVTPGSSAVSIRVSAEVRLQVCEGMRLWCDATADTWRKVISSGVRRYYVIPKMNRHCVNTYLGLWGYFASQF